MGGRAGGGISQVSGAYLKELESFAGAATVDGPEWLEPIRRAARDRFARTGFPSAREEEWRFTPVTSLVQTSWQPADREGEGVAPEAVAPFIFGHAEWCTLVFVNGEHVPGLSSVGSLPPTVVATTLSEALRSQGDLVRRHLGHYAVV